jgi:hypothetical protein
MEVEVEVQAELDSLVLRKMGDGLKGKGELSSTALVLCYLLQFLSL